MLKLNNGIIEGDLSYEEIKSLTFLEALSCWQVLLKFADHSKREQQEAGEAFGYKNYEDFLNMFVDYEVADYEVVEKWWNKWRKTQEKYYEMRQYSNYLKSRIEETLVEVSLQDVVKWN